MIGLDAQIIILAYVLHYNHICRYYASAVLVDVRESIPGATMMGLSGALLEATGSAVGLLQRGPSLAIVSEPVPQRIAQASLCGPI